MKYYLYAIGAILCWASLPAATGNSLKSLSTYELMFYSFSNAALFLYVQNIIIKKSLKIYIPSVKVTILGIWGIFLYHFIYYKALDKAPIAECAVLATTWSFWIVVFSSILTFRKLKIPILITALIGLSGAILVILSGKDFTFNPDYLFGYLLALLCGLIWSSFSVSLPILNKNGEDPMIFFTIITAVISAILFLFETPHKVPDSTSLLSAIYLGFVPLGFSFFLWNRAVHGNLSIIGYLSYFTPPLAVLLVSIVNKQEIANQVIFGMMIIIFASVTGNFLNKS